MSKRSRGPRRNPHQRPTRRPAPMRSTRPLSPLEAAEVAAEDIEQGAYVAAAHEIERAEAPQARSGGRSTSAPRAGSVLASRAAAEYVYVGQDLRRIAVVAGVLFAIMAVLFVLIDLLKVIQL
ncbi:MAG: hypothetical protein ACXVAP_08935 [Candidatus Limnocylindrales bacterium]